MFGKRNKVNPQINAKTKEEVAFADAMRGSVNESVFSEFEGAMAEKNIKTAVDALKAGKGSAVKNARRVKSFQAGN